MTRRRLPAVLALALLLLAPAGCDQTAYILMKLFAPWVPPDEVQAEFEVGERSLLVLVDTDDPALESDFPRLEVAVGKAVIKEIEEREAAPAVVPAHAVEAARRAEPEFESWSVAEVGRYFNVDLVLHIQIYEFRLRESPNSTIFGGYSEVSLRMVSSAEGNQEWPALSSARLLSAETLPTVQPEEANELEAILIEGLATKIVRHFYTYTKEDLPLRPKVQ
jgi:hypothetical protein